MGPGTKRAVKYEPLLVTNVNHRSESFVPEVLGPLLARRRNLQIGPSMCSLMMDTSSRRLEGPISIRLSGDGIHLSAREDGIEEKRGGCI